MHVKAEPTGGGRRNQKGKQVAGSKRYGRNLARRELEKKDDWRWDLEIFKKNFCKDLFHMDGQERMLDDNNLPRLWVCQQGTGSKMSRQKRSKGYALTHGRRL